MNSYAFAFRISPQLCLDYSAKLMAFGAMNATSALQFGQDLCAVRSPNDFADAVIDYTRRQFENWTEQFEEFEELSSVESESKSENGKLLALGD